MTRLLLFLACCLLAGCGVAKADEAYPNLPAPAMCDPMPVVTPECVWGDQPPNQWAGGCPPGYHEEQVSKQGVCPVFTYNPLPPKQYESNLLVLSNNSKEVLRITADGKIIVAPDVNPDDAAKAFLKALGDELSFMREHACEAPK